MTANTAVSATYKRDIPGYKVSSVIIKNNKTRRFDDASGHGTLGEAATINESTRSVRGNMPKMCIRDSVHTADIQDVFPEDAIAAVPADVYGFRYLSGSITAVSYTHLPKAGHTIAADPEVLPMESKVEINDIVYVVEDTGKLVKGNVIDIYFNTHEEAVRFGRQKINVYLVP